MTTFLSSGWMDALLAALNAADTTLSGVHLTLQQTVTGAPDGDVDYWLTFDDGVVTGGLGRVAADADVTMALDHETATALSGGDLNAQSAFMQGKLKITGNMGKLLLNQAAIDALGTAMASIDTALGSGGSRVVGAADRIAPDELARLRCVDHHAATFVDPDVMDRAPEEHEITRLQLVPRHVRERRVLRLR